MTIGERMKAYEGASRVTLPRRKPVILRVDRKSFHAETSKDREPYDLGVAHAMHMAAKILCREIQGAQLAFSQFDEISILLHNYKRLNTPPASDNEVQKLVSRSASIATVAFNAFRPSTMSLACHFDARVFVLPEAEVCNYFIWRQLDTTCNSIQMATRAVYTHTCIEGKNTIQMKEMLHAKGVNWNNYPVGCRLGWAIIRDSSHDRWNVVDPPIFSKEREFIEQFLAIDSEDKK